MAIIYPIPGKAALLATLLEKEVHFELGRSPAVHNANAIALTDPLVRKRIFVKGYAKRFSELSTLSIGYTADCGEVGTETNQLALRLAPMQWVIGAGDLIYATITAPNIDAALAPFNSWIEDGKFIPCYGNHDQDHVDGLDLMLAKFDYTQGTGWIDLGGDGRYFAKELPLDDDPSAIIAHVTVYHSGRNTAMDETEPNGVDLGSDQSNAARDAANASDAPWKILVVHHPPVTGGSFWLEDVAHLLDGTWDLMLCGHAHRCEEINVNHLCRVLNVSAVKGNRGSGTLAGAIGAGVSKVWENDTALAGTRINANFNTLSWEVFDIATGVVIHSNHLRKSDAPYLYADNNGVKHYLTSEKTNRVLLTTLVEPSDIVDGEDINELGIFIGASASAMIAPGANTIPIAEIEEPGDPITLESGLELIHSVAGAKNMTRIISI